MFKMKDYNLLGIGQIGFGFIEYEVMGTSHSDVKICISRNQDGGWTYSILSPGTNSSDCQLVECMAKAHLHATTFIKFLKTTEQTLENAYQEQYEKEKAQYEEEQRRHQTALKEDVPPTIDQVQMLVRNMEEEASTHTCSNTLVMHARVTKEKIRFVCNKIGDRLMWKKYEGKQIRRIAKSEMLEVMTEKMSAMNIHSYLPYRDRTVW